MATIQVADKPTLDAVKTKVDAIGSQVRYTSSVYKNVEVPLITGTNNFDYVTILDLSSGTGGEVLCMDLTIVSGTTSALDTNRIRVTVDGTVISDKYPDATGKYADWFVIKFVNSLKIEAACKTAQPITNRQVVGKFTGVIYL